MQCILGGLRVHILGGGIQYTLGGTRVRMLGEMQYNTGWLVHDCLEYKNGREYIMHISLDKGPKLLSANRNAGGLVWAPQGWVVS